MSEVELPLSRAYACRYGLPVLTHVDPDIFRERYFARCMECAFCHDACCQYGVDVDVENVARIEACADELERAIGVPRAEWFTGEECDDADVPGGRLARTSVRGRGCVFLAASGRGCLLHRFALETGRDYHDLKPMISSLFPLTFGEGLLMGSIEVDERELICLDQGATLYRGVRDELAYYFGDAFVAELDAIEARTLADPAPT